MAGVLMGATLTGDWPMRRQNALRNGRHWKESSFYDSSVNLKWWSWVGSSYDDDMIYAAPVCADLNLDGNQDVVVGSLGPNSYPISQAFRGENGVSLWTAGIVDIGTSYAGCALMDVDGDGRPEVFQPATLFTTPSFKCLRGNNGAQLWTMSTGDYADYTSSPLVLPDYPDAQGSVCFVADSNAGSVKAIVYFLNATTGATRWTKTLLARARNNSDPSYGDVTGDGVPDIVATAGATLYVLDRADGSTLWSTGLASDRATTPALGQLDFDPEYEMILYEPTTGNVKAFNYNNPTPIWALNVGTSGSPQASVGLADFTGDGLEDAVIHNHDSLTLINGASGSQVWKVAPPMTWDVFYGSPVIADMDNDGYWEIVVTGIPEPWSGNRRTLVCMYEHTGALKWRWDQARNSIQDPVYNDAALADVDQDNCLEVLAVDYTCILVCLDSPYQLDGQESGEAGSFAPVLLACPVGDWLTVKGVHGTIGYRIFDASGRMFASGEAEARGTMTLPASGLTEGVYILVLSRGYLTARLVFVKI